ncbi:hypothetical protein PIIN_07094 [Serendipita indica DSM 11827]|uniref:Uncharacterized protein n=1 Tax=Serendipita indica (strain DSM 11827) TaxID=1109443 RepID=G4TP97_SERID|nr:hypothetical protein PIIN_07094 [Serendipita indica DSM 11827]
MFQPTSITGIFRCERRISSHCQQLTQSLSQRPLAGCYVSRFPLDERGLGRRESDKASELLQTYIPSGSLAVPAVVDSRSGPVRVVTFAPLKQAR